MCNNCKNCTCKNKSFSHVGEWLHEGTDKSKSPDVTINPGETIMTFNGELVDQAQLDKKLQEARDTNVKLEEVSPGVWITKQKLFS